MLVRPDQNPLHTSNLQHIHFYTLHSSGYSTLLGVPWKCSVHTISTVGWLFYERYFYHFFIRLYASLSTVVTACVFLWARGHLCFIQLAHITFYPYDLLPKFHFHLSGIHSWIGHGEKTQVHIWQIFFFGRSRLNWFWSFSRREF